MITFKRNKSNRDYQEFIYKNDKLIGDIYENLASAKFGKYFLSEVKPDGIGYTQPIKYFNTIEEAREFSTLYFQ